MNIAPQHNNQFGSAQVTGSKKKSGGAIAVLDFILSFQFVSLLILGLLIFIIYLFYNPPFLAEQAKNRALVAEVEEVAEITPGQTPVIAQVTDAEALRSENQIQADIYANAQNGDYVLGYGERMIIYRESSKSVIYDGPVPQKKIQDDITSKIVTAANAKSINVKVDDPVQLSVVEDTAELQETNAEFYQFAVNGDIIAIFPQSQDIILYRPSESRIINNAKLSISIAPGQ